MRNFASSLRPTTIGRRTGKVFAFDAGLVTTNRTFTGSLLHRRA
jgi:hypothetical protein